MKAAVILNSKAGTGKGNGKSLKEEITENLKQYGIAADFFEPFRVKREKILNAEYDLVAASGGDGTISTAAELITGTDKPLGIIPSGTLNHFAKDNNIPLTVPEAVKVIAERRIKKVDVGEINGKIFVNNSSIGLYPKMVKHRERLGGSKWISMFIAFVNVFKRMPVLQLEIRQKDSVLKCKTPFVFIGNNEYKFDLFNLGTRENIDKGLLSIYYPHKTGRLEMFRYALLALFDKLEQEGSFDVLTTDEIKIVVMKKEVEVALDGEVEHMTPPLTYRILPLQLNLIVPAEK